jgi:hypothetical protein
VDQAGVAQVVQAAVLEDGGAGLEPHAASGEVGVGLGDELRGDAAQGAEHGPAGVDDLELAVAGEGGGVGGQAGGVPAVVTGELAGQVRGGTAVEGAQEGGAVGAWGWGRSAAHEDALQGRAPGHVHGMEVYAAAPAHATAALTIPLDALAGGGGLLGDGALLGGLLRLHAQAVAGPGRWGNAARERRGAQSRASAALNARVLRFGRGPSQLAWHEWYRGLPRGPRDQRSSLPRAAGRSKRRRQNQASFWCPSRPPVCHWAPGRSRICKWAPRSGATEAPARPVTGTDRRTAP